MLWRNLPVVFVFDENARRSRIFKNLDSGVFMLRRLFSRAAALASVLVALNGFSAWDQTVTVVEYYNKSVDAYFISGKVAEQTALDGVADFQRTGMTFQAVAAASAAFRDPARLRPRPHGLCLASASCAQRVRMHQS